MRDPSSPGHRALQPVMEGVGPSVSGKTDLWRDAEGVPAALDATLVNAKGRAELARVIKSPSVRRLILSGNGASWYAANAGWLASIQTSLALEVLSIPAGILASGSFPWRNGDLVLAMSSSGQLRDLLEAIEQPGFPRPFGVVTASPDSPIAAKADVVALISVQKQRVLTHTQAYLGLMATVLDLIWQLARADSLRRSLRGCPDLLERQLVPAAEWAVEHAGRLDATALRAAVCFGSGTVWTAAQEAALLIKEIAAVPTEGSESREGATTSMYALCDRDLALALPVTGDRFAREAAEVCGSRGAHVLTADWSPDLEPRLGPILHFLAPLALAIELGQAKSLDPDRPPWHAAYEATTRRARTA